MKKTFVLSLLASALLLISCNTKKTEDDSNPNQTKTISKDTIISKDTVASASKELAKDTKDLAEVFSQLKKTPQSFLVSASKDTILVCKEGTRIKIKANSFINEKTKAIVTGNVALSVTEYYKMSDIIMARLSTTTDGNLLETGGMLNINARSKTFNCILKKGSPITIEFAKKTKKDGMELYTGEWKNGNINWQLEKNAINLNKTFATGNLDQLPIYPGGNQKMYDFIARSFSPAQSKNGKIFVGFVIDKTGSVTDVKIIKGINKMMDKEALRVVKRLPKFVPGKMNGEPVNVYYTIPIKIDGSEDEETDLSVATVKLEEKYNENTIQNATSDEVSSYIFSTANLGWINCDRLWDRESARVDYVVNIDTPVQASVSIIFHKYGAAINCYFNTESCTFKNIPINEKVTIVAIKCVDGKTQLAVKETVIGNKILNDLAFKSISFEMLKEELKRIDKI